MQRKVNAPYPYLAEFGGFFINLNHKDPRIKQVYETKVPNTPYTGACVGTSVALVDAVIAGPIMGRDATSPFESHTGSPIPFPHPALCVNYQVRYEKSPEHFVNTHMRDLLKAFAQTDIPYGEPVSSDPESLPSLLNSEGNRVYFVKTNSVIKPSGQPKTIIQEHMMVLIKHHSMYVFFDPDKGVALFNNGEQFERWLKKEMAEGSLQNFNVEVPTSLRIYSNKLKDEGNVVHGQTKVIATRVIQYAYKQPTFQQNMSPTRHTFSRPEQDRGGASNRPQKPNNKLAKL